MAKPKKPQSQPKVDGGRGHAVHPENAPEELKPESVRQHNAEVSPTNTDRLIQDGRAHQTKGRGKS
ncbi:MAG TPA: hypothetical protein VGZ22_00120 [Isosphaeraceae bacterium]|jgi:hypothetical protein|nr:hypothetical protein [Isosphaeraceae bacterium]